MFEWVRRVVRAAKAYHKNPGVADVIGPQATPSPDIFLVSDPLEIQEKLNKPPKEIK